ncbi:HD domain-containing protein [Vibrio sp. D404a]|uniref:HD domain-containing phosphohydrolase n=1 Tax=unclassified Vibrio TaxID=2614977 RepID=UPI0025536681|nr:MULTISPECIES: HD domain-containing phosphohydrolase [unclassified Vibrio]MDK9736378.1 HD domain-containing protein [Vibrio sp. D404a]MDK9796000.1 HD domain-containing protein [Vibrio sp. D449a]
MPNSLFSMGQKGKDRSPKIMDEPESKIVARPWKVLLIDDEPDVIAVSKMALSGLKFHKSPIEILSASSAKQAQEILETHSDIALALVDVVMETDSAGLDLIHWIRETKNNKQIRLVLRTGQPGQAPEEKVINTYEINDYKNKTELNATRLKTSVLTALRAYRDIRIISSNQNRLEQLLSSTETILAHSEVKDFLCTAHSELKQFLKHDHLQLAINIESQMPYAQPVRKQYLINDDNEFIEAGSIDVVEALIANLPTTKPDKPIIDVNNERLLHCLKINEFEHITIGFNFQKPISKGVSNLLPHFTSNFVLVFKNLLSNHEIQEVQQQLMLMLSEAIETRSKETGAHVLRVALICEYIATQLGLGKKHVQIIKHAAPMHDLGKIGVPESILHKPAALSDEEWEVMKTHPTIGYNLLSKLNYGIPQMGAMVSLSHHEKWDGSGYPNQVKGEDIPLEGRIMAIADVIDALGSTRSYKKAWRDQDIIDLIEDQKGIHFDPEIADVAIQHFAEIMDIRKQYPDSD